MRNVFTDTPIMVNWNTTVGIEIAVLRAIIDSYRIALMIEYPTLLVELDQLTHELEESLCQTPLLAEESAQKNLMQMIRAIGKTQTPEIEIIKHQVERLRRVVFDVSEVVRVAIVSGQS